MSIKEQRRTMVLTRVVAGSLSMTEAATVLGFSERSVWRLNAASSPTVRRGWSTAIAVGHRLGASTTPFSLASSSWPNGRFEGGNDCHLVDDQAADGILAEYRRHGWSSRLMNVVDGLSRVRPSSRR
jgi:hypothetical protein